MIYGICGGGMPGLRKFGGGQGIGGIAGLCGVSSGLSIGVLAGGGAGCLGMGGGVTTIGAGGTGLRGILYGGTVWGDINMGALFTWRGGAGGAGC